MLDIRKIKAISFDLDDTLWPIWPTIERAEQALQHWLRLHAPMTAAMFASAGALRDIRDEIGLSRPDLKSDLSGLRRESIRLALTRAGENPLLAEPAFDVFFAQRQRVTLFDDALPTLDFLSARFPLVSVSNGNADVERVGLARYFRASISAREFGVGKPDARIFHQACRLAQAQPHEVLHIGDDWALDVAGAHAAGLRSAWVRREGDPAMPAGRVRTDCVVRDLNELVAWLDGQEDG